MSKVVIDANVFVSAIFGGVPLEAVTKAFNRDTVFISPSIEEELLGLPDKLQRKLNPEQILEFKNLVRKLLVHTKMVKPKHKLKVCRDQKDNAYLELCLVSKADFLVTGDNDLLDIPRDELLSSGLENLKVLTPAEFNYMIV